ncbi:hypothetical protein H0O03_02565 [Candidatus Micrarchaeota archaeon]|nr:hypothetical protein [Candidatus Micrarchaeota archaeon]
MSDGEETGEGGAGGFAAFQEKLMPLLKKFAPIIVVAIIAIVGYTIYSSLPQPATLSITVNGLDENKVVSGASVTLTDAEGNTYDGISEDSTVFFDGTFPSGTEFSVSVDAGSKYSSNPDPSSITLSPGENSVSLTLPYAYSLEVSPRTLTVDLGNGCTKSLSVTVNNKGRGAAETTLVAEGDVRTMVGGATTKTIAAGGSTTFDFNLTAPAVAAGTSSKPTVTKKTGSLRLKYTKTAVDVTVNAGAAPQLALSPGDITLTQDDKRWIKVENKGTVAVTDLRVEVETDPGLSAVVQNLVQAIPANGETNFAVDVSAGSPGKYFGKLRISDGGCNPQELTISLTKR